jgi:hypothetical protein
VIILLIVVVIAIITATMGAEGPVVIGAQPVFPVQPDPLELVGWVQLDRPEFLVQLDPLESPDLWDLVDI